MPNPQGDQGIGDLLIPELVGLGVSRARVKNGSHYPPLLGWKKLFHFFLCIPAYSNEIGGFEQGYNIYKIAITDCLKGNTLGLGQFVGGDVLSRRATIHKYERTIIDHSKGSKTELCIAKAVIEQGPEPLPTDFTAFDVHTQNRTGGVFKGRLAHMAVQLQKIFYSVDLTEGDSVLSHPEGAGIHAKKDSIHLRMYILQEILFVKVPCIDQGVIDHKVCRKAQGLNLRPELERSFNYFVTYIIHAVIP